MAGTCNSCGAYEDAEMCSYCPTLVCNRCRRGHELVCEDIQKRKKRGEGPTIRVPVSPEVVVSDVDRGLAGVADLLSSN